MERREESSELHVRTMRKVAIRLMPILLGLYIIAYQPGGGRFRRTDVAATKPVQPVP